MPPRIRAGLRQEATDRLTEQYQHGVRLSKDYLSIRMSRAMASALTRVEADELMSGLKQARERWVNKTRQLLERYFTDQQFAYEYADRATPSGGYGNPHYDATEASLTKGTNFLRSVLEQIPDLEEEEREMPTYTLKRSQGESREHLLELARQAQTLAQDVAEGREDLDNAYGIREEWNSQIKQALRDLFVEREVLSGYIRCERRLTAQHENYGTIRPPLDQQRERFVTVLLGLTSELDYLAALVDVADPPPVSQAEGDMGDQFVHRLDELRKIQSDKWDLYKLITLCEELNDAYARKSFYTVGALLRAIIDHVPPIFGQPDFGQVANNYSGQTRGFKKQVRDLQELLRPTGDTFMHSQIRKREPRPNAVQVDYRKQLDALLEEIVRILG